ncbi:peptidase S41 [Alishewanella longhuensis]|uniref:Peptidase S41 n=1 Tax=Alishewanella longhuensis TaxID=1091037 RepID=A0ABQ3KXH3_9ALTE|nr:S41 family peptidase [Alishewanella longhuensis]GHG65728.1 peptidase S41 [Alishewanella longhuensis]
MVRKGFVTTLLTMSALSLTACGGGSSGGSTTGGSGGGGGNTITAPTWVAGQFPAEGTLKNFCQVPRTGVDPFTRQPYPDRAGTSMHEKMWLRSWTNNTYLWYSEVPDNNPANFSVLAFFDQLKTTQLTDSGNAKDNFHFSENTAQYQQSTQAGVSAGYGIRWSFGRNTPPRSLTIAYTEPVSPAATAGLVRGDRLLSINGVDFVNDNTEVGVNLLNNALFPSATGQSFNFVFESVSGQRKEVTMASANVSSSPVQNVKVLSTDVGKVGYMQFNSHIALAQPQLISAVNQFADENINELVIDLRYNGGGLLALASQLGYMVTGPNIIQDRFFERTIFNDKHPNRNPVTNTLLSPIPFYSREINYETGNFGSNNLPSLNLSRVFILSTANTCSASEAFVNALRGIDVEVILVGGQTCGKPYGFYPTDNCGTTYFTVQFTGVNAKGFGEYSDGFVPTSNPVFAADVKGCPLPDDFSQQLGDPNERLLSAAIYYAQNGSCPSVSNASAGAGGFVLPNVASRIDANAEGQMRLLDPRYQDILFNSKLVTEIKPVEGAQ